MLKHQTRIRQKSSSNNTRREPSQSQNYLDSENPSMDFTLPTDSSPDQKYQHRQEKLQRNASPQIFAAGNQKNNPFVSSEPLSLNFKHDSSAPTTANISRYFNDNIISPQQTFGNSGSKPSQIKTTAMMSDSFSSIHSLEKQLSKNQKFPLPKSSGHTKSNSRTSQQTKSRNEINNVNNNKRESLTFAEDTALQEGIQVLFSKSNKKKKSSKKVSDSPFKTYQKPKIKALEKEITFARQSSKPKSKKKKSKSVKRTKTQTKDDKQPTNIILPNVQKLDSFQRYSFELDNENQLSMVSSNRESSHTVVKQNKKIYSESEFNRKTISEGRAIQIITSYLKHQSKDEKRKYFEKWRFMSIAQRSSVQILAQTRWVNEIQSIRTESEQELLQKQNEVTLRKGLACIFRYRSRRLASMFSAWKYKVQFMKYMENYLAYRMGIDQNESSENQEESAAQKRQVRSHVEKTNDTTNDDYENENINDSEESEEMVLSKQKKICLMQNHTAGRTLNKHYNFEDPIAQLENLPYQFELFQEILKSPNKDFGKLMKLQSENSIQYLNDNIPIDAISSRRISAKQKQTTNNNESDLQDAQNHIQLLNAIWTVKKRLEGQVRYVLREWRRETDKYVMSLDFKIKQKELNLKKHIVQKLASLKAINNVVLIRHMQVAFNLWKMLTLVDKKAENKKLQMYFINNAKLEVQRSKVVLQQLYKQKQLFDQEQNFIQHQRSQSPDPNLYYQQQLLPSQVNQSFGPLRNRRITRSYNSQNQQQNNSIMQLMNPYFVRNQHALPQKLQQIVNQKNNQFEMMSQIKSLCYDMLLDILDEAEKNQRTPNSS